MNVHEYEIGLLKGELDTPALLVDIAAVEHNIQAMAKFSREVGIALRPHAKIYKATPFFAWMQLQAGAIGLTVSKLSEAEVLAAAGIRNILIANQIVGKRKIQRLAHLAGFTDLIVAVDSIANVKEISQAAATTGNEVGILIEVNIGNERCGVEPYETTLEFIKVVSPLPGLKFRGLMGYDGHLAFLKDLEERANRSCEAYKILIETRDCVVNQGIPVEIVSGGGTCTYKSASQVKGLTELQVGTYIFNDTTYRDLGLVEFDCALSVLSTIISRPDRVGAENLAILDVGRKGICVYYGLPEVKLPGGTIFSMPQEHSRLRLNEPDVKLQIGEKVELWVKDANGTVDMYDHIYSIRHGVVETVIDLLGRGKTT